MTLQTLLTTQKEKAREAFTKLDRTTGLGDLPMMDILAQQAERERVFLDSLISSTAKAVLDMIRGEIRNEVEQGVSEYFLKIFNYPMDSKPISGKTVMREEGRGEEVDEFEIWEGTVRTAVAALLSRLDEMEKTDV